jgi:hypothetical protein
LSHLFLGFVQLFTKQFEFVLGHGVHPLRHILGVGRHADHPTLLLSGIFVNKKMPFSKISGRDEEHRSSAYIHGDKVLFHSFSSIQTP